MLILLSPAKNLDLEPTPAALRATQPVFLKEARELAELARALSAKRLGKLMGISDKLAELNRERFAAFRGDGKSNSQKQAALAFNGDVYLGLDAKSLSEADLGFAQERLVILSGLYGLLRPLDAIEPYRLEMSSALANARGRNLYEFWGDRLAREINKRASSHRDPTIINLASKEYFSALDPKTLNGPVVTPSFKEEKGGRLRSLQFFTKRARGLMARWAIQNRIERKDDLKKFSLEGYRLAEAQSTEENWLFVRPQPPLKVKRVAA